MQPPHEHHTAQHPASRRLHLAHWFTVSETGSMTIAERPRPLQQRSKVLRDLYISGEVSNTSSDDEGGGS